MCRADVRPVAAEDRLVLGDLTQVVFCDLRAAPLGREIAFRKNSYFPRVSGMGEYCVRQKPGLLFKCRCKFSDTGLDTRGNTGRTAPRKRLFVFAFYGELCAGHFRVCRVTCFPGCPTCAQFATHSLGHERGELLSQTGDST